MKIDMSKLKLMGCGWEQNRLENENLYLKSLKFLLRSDVYLQNNVAKSYNEYISWH